MNGIWVKDKRFFTLPAFAAMVLSICLAADADAEKKPANAPTTGQAEIKPVEPGFEKGVFTKITVSMGRLIKLNWKDRTLQLDRGNWTKDFEGKTEAEAIEILTPEIMKTYPHGGNHVTGVAVHIYRSLPFESAFIRLRIASGRCAGGIANKRRDSFRTTQLRGSLEYTRAGAIRVMLEEIHAPRRTIVFSDEGNGTLAIVLSGDDGKFSLEVKQGKEGRFSVKHVSGGKVFTADEKSFKTFYARHRSYVEDRLFPLLKHWGIGVPLTPDRAEVKKATLARLRRNRPTGEQTARGEKLIKQLNDNSYKKRQEASKALTADFESYRDLIARTIRNPSTPAETASRLKTIIKAKPKHNPVEKFVIAQGLVTNIDYLIHLLSEASAADRVVVAGELQRLTKQKFGSDPAEWKKWRSKKQPGKSTTKTGKLK